MIGPNNKLYYKHLGKFSTILREIKLYPKLFLENDETVPSTDGYHWQGLLANVQCLIREHFLFIVKL